MCRVRGTLEHSALHGMSLSNPQGSGVYEEEQVGRLLRARGGGRVQERLFPRPKRIDAHTRDHRSMEKAGEDQAIWGSQH